MEIKLTANINGTSKSVIVPIQKVVDAFWPQQHGQHDFLDQRPSGVYGLRRGPQRLLQ